MGAAVLGTASGVIFAFTDDLPAISALDDYSPGLITRVLGRDGSVVGEFATERRQVIPYEDIPVVLRQAIIAAEDGDFMTHGGIHPLLMAWAAVNDVISSRRTPGRSTITQQLARQLFPEAVGFERVGMAGRIRKIKEALVALQIEKRYSKSEILTMYCNKVAWGNRAFGIEAASHLYFAKSAKDLTLDEAATLAGMLPAPQRLQPVRERGAGDAPTQLHPGADGRRGLHHQRRGHGGQGAARGAEGRSRATPVGGAVFHGDDSRPTGRTLRCEGAV